MPKKIVIEIPDKNLLPKSVRRISIAGFLCLLFRHNHKSASENPDILLTDEQIRELARRKFPRSKTIASFYRPEGHTINAYRIQFNKGNLNRFIDYRYYPFVSHRYDEYGNAVEPRRGIMELTEKEQEATALRFFTTRYMKGVYVPSEVVEKLVSLSLVPAPPAHE